MEICETPTLSETVDIRTPSDARKLARQWRREGATGVFTHEGPRLLSVAAFLRDCADRASRQGIVQAFTHEAETTETAGRKRLSEMDRPGSVEGGLLSERGDK